MGPRFIARDDLLTLAQAAVFTGLTRQQIRGMADRRQLAYEIVPSLRRPRRLFRRSILAGLLIRVPAEKAG